MPPPGRGHRAPGPAAAAGHSTRARPRTRRDDARGRPKSALRAAGLSFRKIEYVRGLAHAEQTGALQVDALGALSDEEAIKRFHVPMAN